MIPRRATTSDAAGCAVIVHGWITSTAWMPDAPDLGVLVGVFEKGVTIRELWVIGDPVEGYLSLDAAEDLIHGFYTATPGSGHGKVLLDKVKEGRDYLQLWTHEPNTSAHRFYQREGFQIVERKAEGRGDGIPELRMEWRRA